MTPMIWTRRGLLFRKPQEEAWWKSHAQAVTPLILGPRHWRLYLSGRDQQNRSRMVFIDVDPEDDMRILDRCFEPVLPLGTPGMFDSAGQGACSALLRGGMIHLYYAGIHLRRDVPYGIALGLAASPDGRRFERAAPGPVMAVGPQDPWFCSVAHVTDTPAGSTAWYTSGTGWVKVGEDGLDPVYGLASATSPDGITWTRGRAQISPTSEFGGLTRPWAVDIRGERHLFFAQRGTYGFRAEGPAAYRLLQVRLDADGHPEQEATPLIFATPPAPGDWDGVMQAYPSILPLNGGYVMFYNGNGFGIEGFGWATLDL